MLTAKPIETVQTCDLCRGERFGDLFQASGWRIKECMDCGLVFTSPRRVPESVAELYRSDYYEQATEYVGRQLDQPTTDDLAVIRLLSRWAKRAGFAGRLTGADVGAGAGRRVAAFDQAGWNGIGVEPSLSACEAGRQAGRDMRQGFVETIELDQPLHALTAFHVLEHAARPSDFLHHCRRLLEPGGILLLEVPDFASPAAQKLGADWPSLYPEIHYYQFTQRTLERYLLKNGFRPQVWSRTGGRGCLSPAPVASNRPENGPRPAQSASGLKDLLFRSRKLVYKVPGAQAFCRWLMWEYLRQGEAVRVLATRS